MRAAGHRAVAAPAGVADGESASAIAAFVGAARDRECAALAELEAERRRRRRAEARLRYESSVRCMRAYEMFGCARLRG